MVGDHSFVLIKFHEVEVQVLDAVLLEQVRVPQHVGQICGFAEGVFNSVRDARRPVCHRQRNLVPQTHASPFVVVCGVLLHERRLGGHRLAALVVWVLQQRLGGLAADQDIFLVAFFLVGHVLRGLRLDHKHILLFLSRVASGVSVACEVAEQLARRVHLRPVALAATRVRPSRINYGTYLCCD